MKFCSYLIKKKIPRAVAARELGIHVKTLGRYARGERAGITMILKVKEWSGGEVAETDWFEEGSDFNEGPQSGAAA